MRHASALLVGLIAVLTVTPVHAQIDSAATLALGRRYTGLFYADSLVPIWNAMTPEMQQGLGQQSNLGSFREQVVSQLGAETSVTRETLTDTLGVRLYSRVAAFEKGSTPFNVQWTFDRDDRIAGFFIRPAREEAPSKYLTYRTKTDLRLPFTGEWWVFWGGRTIPENYHAFTIDQRFAYDIVIRKGASSHTGTGTDNTDYYCFGQPILAPAAGVVVEAEDGIDDNKPGVMNQTQAMGNHVILDHGNGEFSFLAHFRKGTIKVRDGEKVVAAQELGSCGNSGNSSEPHLHYHLQTTAVFRQGEGLPAQFHGYYADGVLVERGEPHRGQTIRPR